jgi:hypothetical protein
MIYIPKIWPKPYPKCEFFHNNFYLWFIFPRFDPNLILNVSFFRTEGVHEAGSNSIRRVVWTCRVRPRQLAVRKASDGSRGPTRSAAHTSLFSSLALHFPQYICLREKGWRSTRGQTGKETRGGKPRSERGNSERHCPLPTATSLASPSRSLINGGLGFSTLASSRFYQRPGP